jgi:hypothetical protein
MSEDYRAQLYAEAAARRKAAAQRRGADAQEQPPQQRTEQGPTESRGQIGHSDHYLRLGDLGNPALTTAVGAVAELASHNVPVAVGVGAAVEFAHRYKHLTEDEKTVFDLLRRLAAGEIYTVWVDEDHLLAAMDFGMDPSDCKRLLASMKSRGILEDGPAGWRAVK